MAEHIQINDVQPRIHYVADGVQSAFAFPFAIFKAADLEVWLDAVKQTAGYTVSGAGISTGGTALLAAPPPPGTGVTLRRRLALARTTDYQSDGVIRAKTLNDELDFQVAAVQQVAEELGRAVKRSPTSASAADLTLPEPAPRRALRWNDDGSALVNTTGDPDAAGDATQAAADAQTARDAAVAARNDAVAAAGGVRVSSADAVPGPLAVKLVAGDGIALTASGGGDERLTITGMVTLPQSIFDRLAFLETNLAVNTLRDQIDAGWSVLKMVDGWADEFEDETGIDLAASADATYDATGDLYHSSRALTNLVPSMTSATAPSGTVTWSSSFSTQRDGWHAFDRDLNGRWVTASVTSGWLAYDFGSSVAQVDGYSIKPDIGWPGSNPSNWTFEYWNGSTWVVADTRTGQSWADNTTRTYWLAEPIAGRQKFRLNVSAITGGDSFVVIDELEIGPAAPLDMIVVSNVVLSAQSAPAEARLVLLHEAVDAVTLNTDLIAEVSRDGGTTWSAATLADDGAFDVSTRILSGIADLSAQPAGTAMKWRVRTLNATSQRLHGVWIQWR